MKTRTAVVLAIAMLLMLSGVSEALKKPSIDLKWYGYFKFDGVYDRDISSHGNFIMWVNAKSYPGHDNQFNMTANETRIGVDAIGKNYKNVALTGKLEFDLFASVTNATIAENKPMLQLRHAYFALATGQWKFTAGQTWDLISPLNPSTFNYSVLWGVGNIGYRRPQLSAAYNIAASPKTNVTLAGGMFRTIGGDLTPTLTLSLGETAEGVDDGTDAAIPSFQGLVDVNHSLPTGGQVRFGISALTGQLQAETSLGQAQEYRSWAVVSHFLFNPTKQFGFSGEVYKGSNLGSYFGGILRNSEINGLGSYGGWISGWVQASSKIRLSAGYGLDNPDDNDFSSGRSRNSSVYGNVRYNFVPPIAVGLEVSNWETRYKNAETATDLRVQSSFILNF